jgi:hypothetical protein
MIRPWTPEQAKAEMDRIQEAADNVRAACDPDKVNALVNQLRHILDEQTNADVYCTLAHIISMIALSEGHGYIIPVVMMLAGQSHTRFEMGRVH